MKTALVLLALFLPVAVRAQSYTWTVLAGLPPQQGSTDGSATEARFTLPTNLVADPAGNLYVSDSTNHTIRRIAPDGSATTLAGLAGATGSTDGTGAAARFSYPQGLAIDASRNLYVVDRNNSTIRKISPAGVVTTLAGTARLTGSADGTGADARFNSPWGIAAAPDGSLYVADRSNHSIRKVTAAGVVTTLAGLAGTSGSTDGPGADARFNFPAGLAAAADGTLYVADSNNFTIRKITPDGVVSTLAGTARTPGTTNNTGADARFSSVYDLAIDAAGDLYAADTSNHWIRKITAAGVVTTFAGAAGARGSINGTGTVARFFAPNGIAAGPDGSIFIGDTWNHTIRRITPAGVVTTFSGPGGNSGNTEGLGRAARFNYPHGAGLDGAGNLYLSDSNNAAIRRIAPDGTVSTHTRVPSPFYWGLYADAFDNLIVTDRVAHTLRVFSLSNPSRYVDLGTPGRFGGTDGNFTVATFNQPYAVTTDVNLPYLYVADTGNHVIRRILVTSTAVTVSTLAGTAGSSGSTNGTGEAARFNFPQGVAADRSSNVYVADTNNHTIRRITPAGVVTTFAGSPGVAGLTNATGTAARFSSPAAIVVDATGTLFVADNGTNLIRKITPAGVVTTIGGSTVAGAYFSEGTGSAARFNEPIALAVDRAGAVYVVDAGNNVVMKGVLDTAPVITAPPQSLPVLPGAPVALSVGASGGGLSYQWLRNGAPISGATTATYRISSAQTPVAGDYTVEVSNSAGSTTSAAATLRVVQTTDVGRIVNLAIRSQAGTGDRTLIVGLGVGGNATSGNKPLLVRCAGPALGAFGVLEFLADPKLDLYAGATKIFDNDNWGGNPQVATVSGQVGAFPLGAANARDAALYLPSLPPASYSVQMTGSGGGTGVVLAEIYDATPAAEFSATTPRLTNVSARTQVGTGGDILIAGFVIGGSTAKTILIRAIGPTLGGFGVSGALSDPKLELFAGSAKINENDNWGGSATLSSAFSAVAAFPLVASTRDAVLLVTLAPGGYTAQISGVGDTTGVALVEVYEVP